MNLYKLGNFFFRKKIPFLPKVFDILIRIINNSAVFSQTSIGKGTVFAYGGIALVIHKRAVIGKTCIIGSCVTIGGKSKSIGVPVIGDNCVIGANAVVVKDIPDNCLVAGIPAKVLKTNINPKDYY